ncbi:hypothetical protein V8F20_002432 [Naviculisporaceae sp. PSN 640]
MVGYAFTLSLLGLSAVYALPAAKTVEERQIFGIGEGGGSFGEGNLKPCSPTIPIEQQPPCIFSPIGGGIIPGKAKRQISLGDPTNLAEQRAAVAALQQQLIVLQNKKNKTDADKAQIAALQAMIAYREGIISISAPEGTESSFTHGRRQIELVLPGDYKTNTKQVIKDLEVRLIKLQNKKTKTPKDVAEIKAIKEALKYLAGIISISAPPGSSSTFTPGKRDVKLFSLDSVGTYAASCPNLDAAELAYEKLLQSKKLSVEQYIVFKKLEHFLAGCGVKIIQSPPGTSTTIKPSDKRDAPVLTPGYDLDGLQATYSALIQGLGGSSPSFSTWLALQQIADLLEVYGVTVDRSQAVFTPITPKRQIAIGGKACELTDVMGLKAALAALLTAYGDPAKAPTNIFLIEQVIVTALQICGQSVQGWTTLTPGNPIPGGAIIPDKTIPGGAIVPDKPVPGGPIVPDKPSPGSPLKPSDKRQVPVKDPAALLEALHLLEKQYGTYGSGKIPVPVFLIMVNMVTILQDIPGVVVPGWPILGQGSVSIYPSP